MKWDTVLGFSVYLLLLVGIPDWLHAAQSEDACVAAQRLQVCAPSGGGRVSFATLPSGRIIVNSSAIIAASARIEFGSNAQARVVDDKLRLLVPDPSINATYNISVGIVELENGRHWFDVSVNAMPMAIPAPSPPMPAACTAGPIVSGLNPHGGDLRHFRLPNDSADPALCRAACCNATDCDVWTLMRTGKPGLGAPCVEGKPCCYIKSIEAGQPAHDPLCIASGGKETKPPQSALHNLELEYTFSPPHSVGEEGVLKWMPNLHRGICLDTQQQGTSCWYGNDTRTLTTEHFFRSPAVIGVHSGHAFAVLPDIGALAAQQRAQPTCSKDQCTDFDPDGALIPQALDLHAGTTARTFNQMGKS